jgi:uncharacterized membrane protein
MPQSVTKAQETAGEAQAIEAEAAFREAMRAALHAPRQSAEDKAKAEAKATKVQATKAETRLDWAEVAAYLAPVRVAFETKVDFRGASFIATTGGKGDQAVCTEAEYTKAEDEAYLAGATGRLMTVAGLDRDGELAILALHVEDPNYGQEVTRVEGHLAGTFALVGDTTCTKYFGLKAKYSGGRVAQVDSHPRTDLS